MTRKQEWDTRIYCLTPQQKPLCLSDPGDNSGTCDAWGCGGSLLLPFFCLLVIEGVIIECSPLRIKKGQGKGTWFFDLFVFVVEWCEVEFNYGFCFGWELFYTVENKMTPRAHMIKHEKLERSVRTPGARDKSYWWLTKQKEEKCY